MKNSSKDRDGTIEQLISLRNIMHALELAGVWMDHEVAHRANTTKTMIDDAIYKYAFTQL